MYVLWMSPVTTALSTEQTTVAYNVFVQLSAPGHLKQKYCRLTGVVAFTLYFFSTVYPMRLLKCCINLLVFVDVLYLF